MMRTLPIRLLLSLLPLAGATTALAQTNDERRVDSIRATVAEALRNRWVPVIPTFSSRADSLQWEAARATAARANGFRIVISLFDRKLWAISGQDTLLWAPAGIGTGDTLEYAGRRWTFVTPRGSRTVRAKAASPVWTPPDWAYAEVAKPRGLLLGTLTTEKPVVLSDGRILEVRDGVVGVTRLGGEFASLPVDEHIVFDRTLYIPPIGTKNRQLEGELGAHMLDLGDGYLLHGTPDPESIGMASTHGCIRLRDEDIAWLYEFVPVGTRVYIY